MHLANVLVFDKRKLNANAEKIDQECTKYCPGMNQAGDLIRGSSLTLTNSPDLHTGHLHGLIPVSLSNRSRGVSGGCFCFIITSMVGFSGSANFSFRLRFTVWL
jgi:hypothetical protein